MRRIRPCSATEPSQLILFVANALSQLEELVKDKKYAEIAQTLAVRNSDVPAADVRFKADS